LSRSLHEGRGLLNGGEHARVDGIRLYRDDLEVVEDLANVGRLVTPIVKWSGVKWVALGARCDYEMPSRSDCPLEIAYCSAPVGDVFEHLRRDDDVKRIRPVAFDEMHDIAKLVDPRTKRNINANIPVRPQSFDGLSGRSVTTHHGSDLDDIASGDSRPRDYSTDEIEARFESHVGCAHL
jgi:hypothetical protein